MQRKTDLGTDAQRGYSLIELMAAMLITFFIMAGIYGLMLENQRTYEQQTDLADAQQAARVALDLMTREIRMAGADPSDRAFDPPTECLDGDYKLPTATASPSPGDIAAITVATSTKIRIKMDRPTFVLGTEAVAGSPTPTPNPKVDANTDGDYLDDNEDGLGDGFIDDRGEDVEYEWDAGTKTLYRTTYIAGCPTHVSTENCDPLSTCATPDTTGQKLPIAENVAKVEFKYYSSDPGTPPASPAVSCPAGAYATEALYEAARDLCDVPMTLPPTDMTEVQRVRIRLHVETEKADVKNPKAGKNVISLSAEATIRNRAL